MKTVTVTPAWGTVPETTTSAGNEGTGLGATVSVHGLGEGGGSSAAADVASPGNAASAPITLITPIRESLRSEVRTFLPPVEGLGVSGCAATRPRSVAPPVSHTRQDVSSVSAGGDGPRE